MSDASTPAVAIWAAVLDAIDAPVAIVDSHGSVLASNASAALVLNDPDRFDPTNWTIRPIDDEQTVFVAAQAGSAPQSTADQPPESEHPAANDRASDSSHDVRDIVLRQFFGTDGLMFVVIGGGGRIVELNEALTTSLGIDRSDAVGAPFEDFISGFDSIDPASLGEELEANGRIEAVAQMPCRSADTVRHIHWSIERDDTTGYHFGVGRDITDERQMTRDLRQLAYTDGLTGLANRARLVQLLEEQLQAGKRPAILFCDLDRFKVVNDSLGHAAGDELLRLLGQRFEALLDADVVPARIGGDEFVIMINHANLERSLDVADLVRHAVGRGFIVDGRRVKIGVSVGIALADSRTTDAKHLLGEADTAAYQAKEANRGGVVVYDDDLQRRLDRRFEVEAGLASALAENRFIVHYQPIVQLPGQGIVGVEALVRWRDEEGNLRRPNEFVMIAQDAGLLDEIGDRVLNQATKDIAALRQAGRNLRLAVNATAGQISDQSFPSRVAAALEASGMPPEALTVEVTESAVVDDQTRSIPIMESLRSSGVRIAIDDFGTGYSSLSYLQQLPIDIVKIDRSFVQRIDQDTVALSVVRAVVQLCQALDLAIVVEGIENVEQASLVEQLRCTEVQGYLFHEPLTFDQLTQQITGRLPSRSRQTR